MMVNEGEKVKDTHANAMVTTNDEALAGISHCLSRQLLDTILAIYGALWTATLKHQSDNVNFGSPSNGCFFYPATQCQMPIEIN
jgi:trimethylamine:corrinoid methyltransferase-like protein